MVVGLAVAELAVVAGLAAVAELAADIGAWPRSRIVCVEPGGRHRASRAASRYALYTNRSLWRNLALPEVTPRICQDTFTVAG